MSEWKKKEQPVDEPTTEEDNDAKDNGIEAEFGTDCNAENPGREEAKPLAAEAVSPRYTSRGRRKGRSRAAAPVGFVVLLFAVMGIVAAIVWGVGAIRDSMDNTELKAELLRYIRPVILRFPRDFEDVNAEDIDELLDGTLWYLTNKESIRMEREKTASKYPSDDMDRWEIPEQEVEDAYKMLFGQDAVLNHRTTGDGEATMFDMEYDSEAGVYHMPLSASESMYVTLADKLTKKKDIYTLRVAYIPSDKITIDEHGDSIEPTPDMGEYYKLVSLKRSGEDGWTIISILSEDGSSEFTGEQSTTLHAEVPTEATGDGTQSTESSGTKGSAA